MWIFAVDMSMLKKASRWLGAGVLLAVAGFWLAWNFLPDFDLRVRNLYRKTVSGNQFPVAWLAAHPVGDSVLLTWENPGDALFQSVELYFSAEGLPDRQSEAIPLPNPQSSYLWWTPPAGVTRLHFAAYAVDRNQQVSERTSEAIAWPATGVQPPRGLFTYDYHHEGWHSRTLLPYYVLENDWLRCHFAYGVPIGLENKRSDLQAEFHLYGPLNSFLKDMDIWEQVEGQAQDKPLFSTYLEAFGGDSIWTVATQDSARLTFTAHHLRRGPLARTEYRLDSNQVRFRLQPLNDSRYQVRLNTTGDHNYKAVTHWTVSDVREVIPDGEAADPAAPARSQSYQHRDQVFNDTYPYLNSRQFLTLNPGAVFHLYHGGTELFRLRDIQGTRDFHYKNCTGEENFSFGAPGPYEVHQPALEGPMEFVLEVVY